jgi:DNA-3-methyladenine glycosylase II
MKPNWLEDARAALADCPHLGPWVNQAVDYELKGSSFESVARSIVFQQLSGKAASAIWLRLAAIWESDQCPSPHQLAQANPDRLRQAGLSRQKSSYLIDLGARTADGRLRLEALPEMPDGEVVEALTQVKGIGVWSAQMHLIFGLGRQDVWPVGDLGVRRGLGRVLSAPEMPSPADAAPLGERWAPYRSAAALCCWAASDAKI